MLGCLFTAILEWRITQWIASPGYLIQTLDRLFWFSTFIFLGQHGRGNLATGLLAISTINLSIYFMEGFLSAQDLFIFQCRGIEKTEKRWLYISVSFVLIFSAMAAGLIIAFDVYLYGFLMLKTNVNYKTNLFLWLLLPMVTFHGVQKALQQFFTKKGLYVPVIMAQSFALVSNIIG
jgi:hypothetical protein